MDHPNKWIFLPEGLGWDPENEWQLEEAEDLGADVARGVGDPAKLPRRGMFAKGPFVHVAFDGGSTRGGIATAGFVIADTQGKEVVRVGLPLGPGITNNEAESTACLEALRELARLQDLKTPNLAAPIRVLGDSQLILRMLLGVYKKARKPSLYIAIESVRALCRERGWRVAFRAVPRQMNAVADDMCRRAEKENAKVSFSSGSCPEDAPQL